MLNDVNLSQVFKHLSTVPSGMTAQAGFPCRPAGGPLQLGAVRGFKCSSFTESKPKGRAPYLLDKSCMRSQCRV